MSNWLTMLHPALEIIHILDDQSSWLLIDVLHSLHLFFHNQISQTRIVLTISSQDAKVYDEFLHICLLVESCCISGEMGQGQHFVKCVFKRQGLKTDNWECSLD